MNPLIKKYGKEKIWVNWRLIKLKSKMTKIPYSTTGRQASSTDEKTWATYDLAKRRSDNVGIIFGPQQNRLGIDIDHCLNKETKQIEHEQKQAIQELLAEAESYCEISPSGEGLHIILKIDGSLDLTSNKKAPFEAYTSGRYLTVTEKPYGEPKDVRTVTPNEALAILATIGYPWKKEATVEDKKATSIKVQQPLDDQSVLYKMFHSKNGKKVEALYNGDVSGYVKDGKPDLSSADMSLCSHLAFWTGKDAVQIERMWLASPLGSREKTQTRKDYRDMTITAAIVACKEVYESPATKIEQENPDLDLLYTINSKKDKIFIQNTENICRILRKHPDFSGRFRHDEFKNILEYRCPRQEKWRVFETNDAVNIQTAISIIFPSFFGKLGKDMVYDAMIKVAKECSYDSAVDYLTSLKWDGKARINTWLTDTYGVVNNSYHEAVASNWLKGLVKRLVYPGCKFDYVLVLEGPQGTKKSTSLGVLGRDWHVETTMSTDSKDFFMQFQGKAIIEFSEGETLSRTEVKKMKAIITMQSDKYRPPYERVSQDFPRRCVFAMTTNQDEYLKDETGNRRWLPVKVLLPEANIEWLEANRDQLFAEAYHRVVTLKETVYEFPQEETLREQNLRRIHDPNAEMIGEWYLYETTEEQKNEGITVYQVYRDAMNRGFPKSPLDRYNEMIIADTLKNVLLLDKKQVMRDGARAVRWFRKELVKSPIQSKQIDFPVEQPVGDIAEDEDEDDIISSATKNF